MIQYARQEEEVRRVDRAWRPRGWRLGVVRDLLGDLDSVTAAGQRFTMEKVVVMLGDEVGRNSMEIEALAPAENRRQNFLRFRGRKNEFHVSRRFLQRF